MNINELIIEVTRRCNMNCQHCLRGDAENLDIDINYVKSIFSKVNVINTLTFTGGEPSLATNKINQILDLAEKMNVEISRFYIATNGKNIKMDFIHLLLRMYSMMDYGEYPFVDISNDIYHEDIDKYDKGYNLLKSLRFVFPRYVDSKYKYYKNNGNQNEPDFDYKYNYKAGVTSEGRGKNLKALKYLELESIEYETAGDNYNEDTIFEGNIYLNCEGWIIGGCDWSYENQDDPDHLCRICPVDEFSLDKITEYQDKKELIGV